MERAFEIGIGDTRSGVIAHGVAKLFKFLQQKDSATLEIQDATVLNIKTFSLVFHLCYLCCHLNSVYLFLKKKFID